MGRTVSAAIVALVAVWLLGATSPSGEPSDLRDRARAFARPTSVPHPDGNAWTEARVTLGRTLFFDPRLSASGTVSCATCHNPSFDWADGLPRAVGHGMKELRRRTPTILNLAWAEALFWDGRADTLEQQALGPIQATDEMNLTLEELMARLGAIEGYVPLFEAAYPGEGISADTVAKAIAVFERTVVSEEAPFDRWLAGEEAAMSPEAVRGFDLFTGKASCDTCHAGWRFTDDSFHDIGTQGGDVGRGELLPDIVVTQHAFKTPTLRNVDHRAPYMHNGSEADLVAVIDLYDAGGRVRRESLSPEIRELGLSAREKQDLLAFLGSLTSTPTPVTIPRLPR